MLESLWSIHEVQDREVEEVMVVGVVVMVGEVEDTDPSTETDRML